MFLRGLVLGLALLLVSACSTTGKTSTGGAGADGMSAGSVEDRYAMESGNLEAFTPIEGSAVGARAHDRVFFGYDSAVLSSTAQGTLDRQVSYLKKNSSVTAVVEGHCDERGTREYNLALGERRAAAVKSYLVNSGIESGRITVISYGKERPAVMGSDESSWAENRRGVTVLQ